MLYNMHQLSNLFLKPLHKGAKAAHTYLQNFQAQYPTSPLLRWMDANNVLLERDTREYERPSFNIQEVQIKGRPVLVTEEVLLEHPFCTLRHFKKHTKNPGPQVLLVAPLAGHYPTLLKGTVARLLESSDVLITDWKNAREVPLAAGPFDLDDYIGLLLQLFQSFQEPFHVIAVCQPTVPVTIATILCEQNKSSHTPRTLTLMGGPVDTRQNPSQINVFAKSHSLLWFQQQCITTVSLPYPGAYRRVCPGFLMLSGFMSIDPKRHMESHLKFYENLVAGSGEESATHTRFYDEYRSVMDLPGEFVMQTLDRVFQRHLLPLGEFEWHGRLTPPTDLKETPILTIEGALDNISPPGQTVAIHGLTPHLSEEKKFHHLQQGAGHYGIFSGRKWREEVAPVVEAFINKFT